jgi:hypothetical protein
MSSLTRFENDGIELVIDTTTGECFYPGYRALARICSVGLPKLIQATQVSRTIETLLEGVTEFKVVETEILTDGGFQGVTLIPRKLGTRVIKKYNENLYDSMAEAGHLVFLHQLVGYKVTSTPIDSQVKEQLPVALPPGDIRVTNLIGSLTALGIELTNPRIKQGLQDLTLDLLGLTKSLPSAAPIDIWAGVAERAEELGYAPGLVVQYRSQLGKYVKSFSLESKQEKRICNGTQRPINIYKVSDDLDNAIKEFMDAKVLAS